MGQDEMDVIPKALPQCLTVGMCILNVGLRTFESVAKEISEDLDNGLVEREGRDGMQLGWRMRRLGAQPDLEPI